MGKVTKDRKRGRRLKPSPARWVILAVAAIALVAGGSIVYFSRPGATAGPKGAAVSAIEHVHGLAVDPSRPEVLWIGTHGSLIRVTGGKQWRRIGPQTYDMMGFNIHPTEPNVLLTSGHPGSRDRRPNPLGVEISRDAGQTWQPLAMAGLADFHAMTISRADPNRLWAWSPSGRPGLYRSLDGGRQWEYLRDPLPGGVFALAAHPQRADIVLAGTARGLHISEDAGLSWRLLAPSLSGIPVTAVEVHPKQPRIVYAYAVHPDLGLIRSEDGGQKWSAVGFFLGPRDAVGNITLDPTNP
ncbi:MAG: F510_1955 family glycosylhydrolase, partial [bacterium]